MFIKSKDIKVFPTGFRGSHLETNPLTHKQVNVLFDPESKLNTERNLTNLINFISRKIAGQNKGDNKHAKNVNGDGVIVDVRPGTETSTIDFILHGYYFSITLKNDEWPKSAVYAHIKTEDHSSVVTNPNLGTPNSGFAANTLENLESGDLWDNLDNDSTLTTGYDDSEFCGVELVSSPVTVAGEDHYNIKLLDAETATKDTLTKRRVHINDFRFDESDIQSVRLEKVGTDNVLKALASSINEYFESYVIEATEKFSLGDKTVDEADKNIVQIVAEESGDIVVQETKQHIRSTVIDEKDTIEDLEQDITNVTQKITNIDQEVESGDFEVGTLNETEKSNVDINGVTLKSHDNKSDDKSGTDKKGNEIDFVTNCDESGDLRDLDEVNNKSYVQVDIPRNHRKDETLRPIFEKYLEDESGDELHPFDAVPEGYMQIRINQGKSEIGDIIYSGLLKTEAQVIAAKSPDDEYEASWIKMKDGEKDPFTGLPTYVWIKAAVPAANTAFLGMRMYSTTNYDDTAIKDIIDRLNIENRDPEKYKLNIANSYSGGKWEELVGKVVTSEIIWQPTLIKNEGYADPLYDKETWEEEKKLESYTGQYEVMDAWWEGKNIFDKDDIVCDTLWTGSTEPDDEYSADTASPVFSKTLKHVTDRFKGTWEIIHVNVIHYEKSEEDPETKVIVTKHAKRYIIQANCTAGSKGDVATITEPLYLAYEGRIVISTSLKSEGDVRKIYDTPADDKPEIGVRWQWEELTDHPLTGTHLYQWKLKKINP